MFFADSDVGTIHASLQEFQIAMLISLYIHVCKLYEQVLSHRYGQKRPDLFLKLGHLEISLASTAANVDKSQNSIICMVGYVMSTMQR